MTDSRIVVVPLDGSALAEKALPVAVALARATPVELVLVRATLEVDSAALSRADAAAVASARERSELREAKQALEDVRSRLDKEGISVSAIATGGAPADVILDVAAHRQAALIVLTTHGYAGLERVMYGSVAAEVLRRATIPLLVVPRAISATWADSHPHRVLVLVDGSTLSERVLEPAGVLARALQAEVLVSWVLEPPPGSTYAHMPHRAVELREREQEQGQQYLDGLRDRLPQDLPWLRMHALVARHTTLAIRQVATDERCDVIAMASHGRGGLSRLLFGSTAAELVREATTPMLIVGPNFGSVA